MERYEEAIADFNRVIALDEKYVWALSLRGRTYRLMERYEEAIADFDRAIALNEKDIRTLTFRGETYRLMERYEEALADFDRVIALNENSDWQWYDKALVYLLTDQRAFMKQSLSFALDIANSRVERLKNQGGNYYRLRFNAALYLLVDGRTEESEANYRQLLSTCSIVSRLRAAITDLEEFLTIQPTNMFAQVMLALVKKSIG